MRWQNHQIWKNMVSTLQHNFTFRYLFDIKSSSIIFTRTFDKETLEQSNLAEQGEYLMT